jgi:hypothetical protein
MNEATRKEAHILMIDDEVSSTCLMTNFLNPGGSRKHCRDHSPQHN